jgi:tetratricopeptide (TPR) repeat protein
VLAGTLAIASTLTPPPCQLDRSALAGVWDEQQRTAMQAAFAATQLEFADQSARHVQAALDVWSDDWITGQRDACMATRVHGLASLTRLDQRTACYARKRDELRAIVELLTIADTDVVVDAAQLMAGLPELDDCSAAESLDVRFPLPEAEADAIRAAYSSVAQLRVLIDVGRFDAAQQGLAELERATASLHYPPLALELRAVASEQAIARGNLADALAPALAVVREAEALQLDEFVARERVWLVERTAALWGQPERERDLLDDAAAAVARLGREPGPLDVDLLDARGRLAERVGEFEQALARFDAAAALARELGDVVRETRARLARARIHAALGHDEAAAAEFDAAANTTLERLGPGAPMLASIELDRALLAMQRGKLDQAQTLVNRARSILDAVYGEHAPATARAELVAARLALLRGDLDAAAAASARAAQPGVAAVDRANALEGLGVIEFLRGDARASVESYRRALVLREQQLGEEHPELAVLHSNLGESFAALGEYEAALEEFELGIALLQRKLPAEHLDFAFPYKGRGQARLALGSPALARLDLERALALHEQHPSEPLERADVEFSLARALFELGEAASAETLAQAARTHYLELDQSERAAEIAAWLTAHAIRN